MTRGIIGCVILALLLAAGLGVQWAVAALQAPITGELTQAAQAAAREDWDTALLHQETAQRGWRKAWRLTAAFADHQPMEDVDSLFARLPAYGETLWSSPPAAGNWQGGFGRCMRPTA